MTRLQGSDNHDMMLVEAEEQANVHEPQPEPEPENEPQPSFEVRKSSSRPTSRVLTARSHWMRPDMPPLNNKKDTLEFMQVDASKALQDDTNGAAVINLFGITEQGHSALIRAYGFHPYLLISVASKADGKSLMDALNDEVETRDPENKAIIRVEKVQRRSLEKYFPQDPLISYFKISVLNPKYMTSVSRLLRDGGLTVKDVDDNEIILPPLETYEASVDYILRFMIEKTMSGCTWVSIPPMKYEIINGDRKTSHCQLEVKTKAADLIVHQPEGEWLKTAPIRRLSVDIECMGRRNIFPDAKFDSVIQIANYIWNLGEDKPAAKVIFTLKSCSSILGADVISYEKEEDLLSAWADFLRFTDPDLLTGYNIINFDFPYLIERAETLGLRQFPYLGRLKSEKTRFRLTQMSSSAFGSHDSRVFYMQGRIFFDMLQLIIREHKLRSYSLNSVSAEFLGQQKEDVPYTVIPDLQMGDDQTRRRLAVYCLKDALLPLRLMDKLLSLVNYMEMARVTGIPLGWLVTRGHMIKVVSLLHRKSRASNLLVPDKVKTSSSEGEDGKKVNYEGAIVLDPEVGYYEDPIATLDFASLYPSIIMAHNLCYCTLVDPKYIAQSGDEDDLTKIPREDVTETPSGAYFIKPHKKVGMLTMMLRELLAARKQAKKDMKVAKDPFLKSVLNGRQLALKISANAVYGFTGATVGKLPCLEISESTTAFGRVMIEKTKQFVLDNYKGSTVIYGDTDSVMIKFGGGRNLAACMELGEQAAARITKEVFEHEKPVKLEFEKCYWPYLLINKKRYAGLLWTGTEKSDKMDVKGIEIVRRDSCMLVAKVMSKALDLLLKERRKDKAIQMVKDTISDLLQNKIDISLLVVSKMLTKDVNNYVEKIKQAHVELVKRLRDRRDKQMKELKKEEKQKNGDKQKKKKSQKKMSIVSIPAIGDRVPYVIVEGAAKEPMYRRSEDPLYVLEQNLAIDNRYYLDHMLRKPLERIFEPVMGEDVKKLFAGDHTRKVYVPSKKNKGAFASFGGGKSESCLGCRTPIKPDVKGVVCGYCVGKPNHIYNEAEIYYKQLQETTKLEKTYASLWTECQRCMGDVCRDILCNNSDCPIFYRRRKVQIELDRASTRLTKFIDQW